MKTLTLILALVISVNMSAQNDHIKYAAFNIVSSSIIGGIGSGIHHKENESFGKAFVNGAWKGAISGSINSVSKEMLRIQSERYDLDWRLCWGSKIVNSVSNTMLYNATMNESSLLKHYSIDIGFIRLSTDYTVQIEPISLACFTGIFFSGGKFDVSKSLTIGTPVFLQQMLSTYGKTYANNITINNQQYYVRHNGKLLSYTPNVILHELTHTYQRLQYSSINNFLTIYNKYENIKPIHNDLSSFDILYLLNKTYFENEAMFYGNNN